MAYEYYLSLPGIRDATSTLRSVNAQLEPYRQYLERAEKAAHECALSLAWREPNADERRELQGRLKERFERKGPRAPVTKRRRDRQAAPIMPAGDWIMLEPRPDDGEEAESTFIAFGDAKEIYERPPARTFWSRDAEITVLAYDSEAQALLLARAPRPIQLPPLDEGAPAPSEHLLFLRPVTWPLQCQKNAIAELKDRPHAQRSPLLGLANPRQLWPIFAPASVPDWVFLRDAFRSGADEQRRFVQIALNTPDFAVLEGPPGSGKTTAICELICQLARNGKRVLLVASTHVAVDNVLEKLMERQDESGEKLVMPIRIGDENRISSPAVEAWALKKIVPSWRGEVLDFLDNPKGINPVGNASRTILQQAMAGRGDGFQRLILEASNLVCGTTIGILQHPAIKNRESLMPFDVMILDEASKTTFAEFLVPALHARRWIVVGDRRQLSPYVEEQDLRTNLRSLRQGAAANALLCAFLASRHKPEYSLVAVESDAEAKLIITEAEARKLVAVNLDTPEMHARLPCATIVCGRPATIEAMQHRIPGDLEHVFGRNVQFNDWQAHRRALGTALDGEPSTWESEVAWRLIRRHELRDNPGEAVRLDADLKALEPMAGDDKFTQQLNDLRRVSLPSILEILQRGAGSLGWNDKTVLTSGFSGPVLMQRMVSLSYQHRMHPDISAFPRSQFYAADNLLHDAVGMREQRHWSYSRYSRRGVWIDVPRRYGGGNSCPAEANAVLQELKAFGAWAQQTPKLDKDPTAPWEVAVLTFYRGQERELRSRLRKACGQPGRNTSFELGERVRIKLATVDRFQGQEADLVLLSFVKSGSHGFLNSPNRLNVALTRARYQLVLIGHRSWMGSVKCRSDLLRAAANTEHYDKAIGWGESQ